MRMGVLTCAFLVRGCAFHYDVIYPMSLLAVLADTAVNFILARYSYVNIVTFCRDPALGLAIKRDL